MVQRIRLLAGEKQQGESRKAIQACNDWLRLGRGRSLPALIEVYTKSAQDIPITRSLATLKKWSSSWEWDKRAEIYDAELERQKNERRERVMNDGLALDFERTDELKQLAQFLLRQLYDQDTAGKYCNLWLKDFKQIGAGEQAEKVEIERFNAALIDQLRGALDDLAKETGGRAQKHEVSGADGGPVTIRVVYDGDDGTPEKTP